MAYKSESEKDKAKEMILNKEKLLWFGGAILLILGLRNVARKDHLARKKKNDAFDKMFEDLKEQGTQIEYDEDLLDSLEFDEDEDEDEDK